MRRKSEETLEVPLSTLIDVVFLLIIFFVVTATLQKEVVDSQIELAKAHFAELDDGQNYRMTINIRNREGEPPVYSIGGSKLNLAQIKSRLHQARLRFGESFPVVLRASDDLEYREIDKVNQVVLQCGLFRVQHSTFLVN